MQGLQRERHAPKKIKNQNRDIKSEVRWRADIVGWAAAVWQALKEWVRGTPSMSQSCTYSSAGRPSGPGLLPRCAAWAATVSSLSVRERKGKEGLPFTRTRGLLAYWRGPISEDARRLLGRGSPHLRGRFLFVCLFFTEGVLTKAVFKNKALRHNAASHV